MASSAPKYFKTWIIYYLIAVVGALTLSAVAAIIIGVGMKLAHAEPSTIKWTARITGFLISAPISWFSFRWVVEEFIVKDLTQTSPPAPPAEPPPLA